MKQIFSLQNQCSTQKETRCIFLILTTLLLIIILMDISFQSASALDFSFTSPEEAKLGEELIITLDSDSPDTHDIKVFIHKSEDQTIERNEYISEVYNDEWSDPWYYIQGAFPSSKEIKIRSLESCNYNICVRLRSETKSTFTECKPITITENANQQNQERKEENNDDEETEKKEETDANKETVSLTANNIQQAPDQINRDGKIILNQRDENQETETQKTFTTKTHKTRQWILYSFLGFCILIIILLALKQL